MRLVLAWLVALGMIAGLSARTLPGHSAGGHAHVQDHEADLHLDCDHGSHREVPPCDHDGSGHPCHDPHHHHGCCSPVTISADAVRECRLSPPGGVLLGIPEHRESMPDDPYLEREAPPLI